MKVRWYILVFTLFWCAFALYRTCLIGPLTKPEEMVSIDHPSQASLKVLKQNFVSQFSKIQVDFVFGVKDIDRTGESMWNSSFIGEAIMDPEFDASCKEC